MNKSYCKKNKCPRLNAEGKATICWAQEFDGAVWGIPVGRVTKEKCEELRKELLKKREVQI